jgi:hypothetical protein
VSARRALAAGAILIALSGCGSSGAPATVTVPAAGGAGGGGSTLVAEDSGSNVSPPDDASTGVGGSAAGDAAPTVDCLGRVAGVTVDERELQGFPPYAVDGCTLVYVSRTLEAGAHGDLHARDLARGQDTVIATADEAPRRPTISGGVIAWEATIDGISVVRVSFMGTVRTLSGTFDHAGEPRAAADGVVFTVWSTPNANGDTDVDLYLPQTGEVINVAGGPNQQRFADISPSRIAFTDFSEDPDGHYDGDNNDLADIGIYDRATRKTTMRPLPMKQAFPMLLAGDQVAYLHWDWAEVHPEPKLAAYHLRVGSLVAAPPSADREVARVAAQVPPYVRPAVHEGTLEWVDSPDGEFHLWRAAADGSSPPATVDGVQGVALYAPAPTKSFTVLATRANYQLPPELFAVAR